MPELLAVVTVMFAVAAVAAWAADRLPERWVRVGLLCLGMGEP
jgi:hypothetical protein